MPLNKQTGNMYPFVTHTWNPIRGMCPHDCDYCYMKVYPQPELHFAEKEMDTKLGHHNYIFVGSSTDMWAREVPKDWIIKTLKHCRDGDAYNQYLFQSKNPARFLEFLAEYPDSVILGTTIKTNRDTSAFSKAPSILDRFAAMSELGNIGMPLMLSFEPIIDFDIEPLLEMVRLLNPKFVSLGADSKGHSLPEPTADKLIMFKEELTKIAEIRVKNNLSRLLRQELPDS